MSGATQRQLASWPRAGEYCWRNANSLRKCHDRPTPFGATQEENYCEGTSKKRDGSSYFRNSEAGSICTAHLLKNLRLSFVYALFDSMLQGNSHLIGFSGYLLHNGHHSATIQELA